MDPIETLDKLFTWLSDIAWGPPMLVLLVGTGLYLTLLLKGLQFTSLPHALRLIFRKDDSAGDISHFAALMTALAATVGNGNIVGVASAIALGGPGAIFWMWMTGLVGMATKYGEAVLAIRYRESGPTGMRGGPMYYLSKGLGLPWLGAIFALFAAVAAFGIGNMFQAQSVAGNFQKTFQIPQMATGFGLMLLTGMVVIGGIRSIARCTSFLVPVMIVGYCLAAIICIVLNASRIPEAFGLIFTFAFTPSAAMGGTIGSLINLSMRQGVARGVFSNESGLGSSPIAAAAARTPDPCTQALVSMTQTFIDTIIVCTMTALVILTAPFPENIQRHMTDWQSMPKRLYTDTLEFVPDPVIDSVTGNEIDSVDPQRNVIPTKEALTALAMDQTLGKVGGLIVALASVLFAYSTLLGWCYYGEKSVEFLFGMRAITPFRILFSIMAFVGTALTMELIIKISDTLNALMAIPNLIGLIFLAGVIKSETNKYFGSRSVQNTAKK